MKKIFVLQPHLNPLLKGEEDQGKYITMQQGQILLIVVLIMLIALTVGLSLVSRSIINLKSTNEEADSQKAFQAAEAGVEIALQKPLQTQDISIGQKSLGNGSTINQVAVHTIAGSSMILNAGDLVAQDQGIDVWLTNYPDYSGTPWTGNLYIYWGNQNGCKDAALEAIVISGIKPNGPNASATIDRYGIDPCGANSIDTSADRTGSNHFKPAQKGQAVAGKSFNFATAISITNGIVMRLIPLYTNTPVAIVGYTNANPPVLQTLPPQGRIITSTGAFGSTVREVSFFEGYPLLPSEFFSSVFQK